MATELKTDINEMWLSVGRDCVLVGLHFKIESETSGKSNGSFPTRFEIAKRWFDSLLKTREGELGPLQARNRLILDWFLVFQKI